MKSNSRRVFGLVLSGGQSKRMKTDKSALLWYGKTVLDHSCLRMLDCGCDKVLLSKGNTFSTKILQNVSVVVDRYQGSGPLAGFEAAVSHCLEINSHSDTDVLLIMPIDMPIMSIELLKRLIDQSAEDVSEFDACFYSVGRFPLVLRLTKNVHATLLNCLEKGQTKRSEKNKSLSIKSFLNLLECKIIPCEKQYEDEFINCNTPEQWQSLPQT